jgi:hypothetical protein
MEDVIFWHDLADVSELGPACLKGEGVAGDAGHSGSSGGRDVPVELGGSFEGSLGSVCEGSDAGRFEVVFAADGRGVDVLGGGGTLGFDGWADRWFSGRLVFVGLNVAFCVGMGGVGPGAGIAASGLGLAVGLTGLC